jgi:transcriptional regulator with XRE-family HTH domain
MKKRNGKHGFVYRSYNFVNKDPVIDKVRTIVQDEGLSYGEIHILSSVSDGTLRNWFEGETRRPQYATVAAVTSALGYTQEFKKARKPDFDRELQKARKEIEAAK